MLHDSLNLHCPCGTVSFSLILVPGCHRHRPYVGRFRARASGHAAGHQAHEVEGTGFGLQPPPPAVAPGPGVSGLAAGPGPGGSGHTSSRPRMCRRCAVWARRTAAGPGLLPSGPARRQSCRRSSAPALFQDREPAAPVKTGATQAQVQAFALGAQDPGNRCCARTGRPPVPERSAGAGGRSRRAAGARHYRDSPCTANAGRAGSRARPGGGDGCHCAARRRPRNGGRRPGNRAGPVGVRDGQGLGLKSTTRGPVDFGQAKPSAGAPSSLARPGPIATRLKQCRQSDTVSICVGMGVVRKGVPATGCGV